MPTLRVSLRRGKKAKICNAKRIKENTARSLWSREARTTEAEIAAFIDKTEVKLNISELGKIKG
jgi:hypothetical protein